MQIRKENPFLGLKPYGENDHLYGRDKDLFLMTDRIFCARTTLLFAGSGVGKTSFINAKIIPELKSQYASIIYHNKWAIGQPLENLMQSIVERLPAADPSPSPAVAAVAGSQDAAAAKPPSIDVSNKLACYLKQFRSEEPGSDDTNRCLLILDQFEEVFQHHRGKHNFDVFIKQLTQLINHKHFNVRVLFSMREEFLGELSIFDNKIPDLFSNYYRLKCPNKQEAKTIIAKTCGLVDMPVEHQQLTKLVGELARIEQTETTTPYDQNGNEAADELDLDLVEPPYLQIACRRLWERQFNSANSIKSRPATSEAQEEKFLSDYQRGDAREMLKSFCEEILNAFNKRERALLAEAFNYLVTKKGAKMAYALSSLADHMGVKEAPLESILHRLSDPDSRILRESQDPDRALWYELYHDMYGKIIDEWRRAYRLQQKKEERRNLFFAAGLIVLIALLTIWLWQWLDRRQDREATLRNGDLNDQVSYQKSKLAFEDLQNTLFSGNKGRVLWGDAWKRRASSAERIEDAQLAVLSLLKAAEVYPANQEDPSLLSEINSYLNTDEYGALLKSYRLEIGVTTSPAFNPILTADGKMLLTVGRDREVFFWDTESYQKLKSTHLAVDSPSQINFFNAGPPGMSQHAVIPNPRLGEETQIQAATENLIGGLDNDKFCIWDASTGQKLWQSDSTSGPRRQDRKLVPTALNYDYYQSSFRQSVEKPSLSLSSNGQYFATSNGSDSFRLYRLGNNKVEAVLEDLMRSVTKVEFSPDGHNVALVLKDGTAQLRDLDTTNSRSLPIAGKSVQNIIFSPDGSRFLADMGFLKPTEIWDTGSGSIIQKTSARMGEQFFCPDNRTIVSILPIDQRNATIIGIRFWDSETQSISIRAIKFDERTEYFISPNGKSLLTIGGSGSARLWSLAPPSASANNLITDSAQIGKSEISGDGQTIVIVNDNQELSVWNANDLKRQGEKLSLNLGAVPVDGRVSQSAPIPVVNEVVVSSSAKYVCLKTNFDSFSVRKLRDKTEIIRGTFESSFARAAAFSPNEEAFAVANKRDTVTLWQQLDTTPNSKVVPVPDAVSKLVFSPDGKYLVAIGRDYPSPAAHVIDLATSEEMLLPTDEVFTSTMALGRNGLMIGTIRSDDKAVVIWDSANRRVHKLRHDSSVTAVALTYEGKYALTSTSNGSLQLWETASGKPIANGRCSTRILSLTMSDDGKTAVARSDKWVHIHSISTSSLDYVDGREIASPSSLRILDQSGRKFRGLFPPIQDALKVELFDFSSTPIATGPVGDAAGAFSTWTKRLALDFDQNGLVTPVHPQ
jgi:WD40 repeat protein